MIILLYFIRIELVDELQPFGKDNTLLIWVPWY